MLRSGSKLPRVGATRKKKVALEQGPLSLVRIIEELLERKVAAVGIRCADHATPSIR
jgi:hypothetical protein